MALEKNPGTDRRFMIPVSGFPLASNLNTGDNQCRERPPLRRLLLSNQIYRRHRKTRY